MSKDKATQITDECQKSIEKEVEKIFKDAEARERAGGDFFEVGWQATQEIMLLVMKKHLLERPGQLLPMQIEGKEESDFYLDIQEKLDLPPDTCAVLVTPTAFKNMPLPRSPELEKSGMAPWHRNAYSVIISGLRDHRVVMQASLPGLEYSGIDVFEEGKHLADYMYNTVEECIDDLTKVTWIHFHREEKWTEEQIISYTENWFGKCLEIALENAMVHEEYSYLHHPELLSLTPLDAVFRVIQATVPKEYESLEKAIEIANDLNRDFNLGYPPITKEGILEDKEGECESLLGAIEMEIDQHLETMECLKGVRLPSRSIKNRKFKPAFDETAIGLYEVIAGRPCPCKTNS
jgi:hypothetical protein